MESVKEVTTGFRQARIVGEDLLAKGLITWDNFADMMREFEQKLRNMGQRI
jgi:hypothetical protein